MIAKLEKARIKVLTRQQLLIDSVDQFYKIAEETMKEAEVIRNSRKLNVTQMSQLLEVDRSTIYDWEASSCNDYKELWEWVRDHKPERLTKLEKNYELFRIRENESQAVSLLGNKGLAKRQQKKRSARQ